MLPKDYTVGRDDVSTESPMGSPSRVHPKGIELEQLCHCSERGVPGSTH